MTPIFPWFRMTVIAAGWLLSLTAARAAGVAGTDWSQYRGSTHDGISTETLKWPMGTPHQLWKVATPGGFSTFAIGGGVAATLIDRGGEETCLAVDANTGAKLWEAQLGQAKYDGGGDTGAPDNRGTDGPRSTPTIDGDKLYTLSAYLVLSCFELKTGKKVYSKDLCKEFLITKPIQWQFASSPVLDGDLIFVCTGVPGVALVGLHKKDGSTAWKCQADKATHSSPIVTTILGQKQVIFFTQSGLASVVPESGAFLWNYKFPYKTSTAISPVVCGDMVYCSAGYDTGAAAVKLTKVGKGFHVQELWMKQGNALCNHWSTPVAKDGYLYGIFGFKQFGTAPLKCVEMATGKEMWSKDGFGPGGVILVGGNVLALGDKGQLVLAEGSPKAFNQLGRYHAITGKCWNSPSFSNGHVFVRSTKEGACFDMK